MAAKKVEKKVQVEKAAKVANRGSGQSHTTASATKGAATTPPTSLIAVGSPLPKAKLLDQDGTLVELTQFNGSWLVVYFYPKDDTPGCSREACSFQEQLATFKRQKTTVLGVSPDNALRHRKFADKYGLRFPLLVDEDRSFATACGVIGEKVLYGKRSLGVIRSTLIVDPTGVVRKTFHKVKVDGHTEEVLQALQSLRKA